MRKQNVFYVVLVVAIIPMSLAVSSFLVAIAMFFKGKMLNKVIKVHEIWSFSLNFYIIIKFARYKCIENVILFLFIKATF